MGEETKAPAYIETEQGNAPGGQVASRPKNGAIATKDTGQLGQRGRLTSSQLRQILGGGTGLSKHDLNTFPCQLISTALGLGHGNLTALA
jgi:hypothetical protein